MDHTSQGQTAASSRAVQDETDATRLPPPRPANGSALWLGGLVAVLVILTLLVVLVA